MRTRLVTWVRRLIGMPTEDVFIGYVLAVNLPARLEFDFSTPIGATEEQREAAAFRAIYEAANMPHEGVQLALHIPNHDGETVDYVEYHPNVNYLWWQHA